ncbi:MAG: sigma-70 family RNA polymerase sigma factor [Chloroflexi bacterium]|nr:sigma-70 family RNA polymerase sigma factor [Chloroflexota bacterium]
MDEQTLVTRGQRGDLDAFNSLVEAYQAQAYNIALRMLGDPASAEDATQDAFISAYRNLGSFRGGSFRAWLLRIVTNACYDQLRAAKRHPTAPLDPLVLAPSREEQPEDYALRQELGEAIRKGLQALPADQRLAIVLADIQGLDYEEVAQVTSTNVGTVKSRIARGRARLRDYLMARRELLPAAFRLVKGGGAKP